MYLAHLEQQYLHPLLPRDPTAAHNPDNDSSLSAHLSSLAAQAGMLPSVVTMPPLPASMLLCGGCELILPFLDQA